MLILFGPQLPLYFKILAPCDKFAKPCLKINKKGLRQDSKVRIVRIKEQFVR